MCRTATGRWMSTELFHHLIRKAQIRGLKDNVLPLDPFGIFQFIPVHMDFSASVRFAEKTRQQILGHAPGL